MTEPTAVAAQTITPQKTRHSRRRRRSGHAVRVFGSRLCLAVVLLGLWQLAANRGWVDIAFVSSPKDVWAFLKEFVGSGEVWHHLWVTLKATLMGFTIGSLAGIAAGLLLATVHWLDELLDPFLTVLNSLPRVALAPLFLLWFGLGIASKVALAVSLVFFILLVNTRAGVRNVDPDIVTVSRLLGGGGRRLFQKVILPAAVPSIAAGLHLAVIYSLLGVVVGEMIAAEAGLGQRIAYYSGQFNTGGVLGVLAVLALIAAVMNATTVGIERRLLRWQDRGQL